MKRLNDIQILDPQPARMRSYSKRSKSLDADGSNLAGYLVELAPDEKERVETVLSQQLNALSGGGILKVYAEAIQPINKDALLLAVLETTPTDSLTDGRLLSDGTLRYLAIIVAIATAPRGSLLVLEEVDDGLHPARAEQLARFLREQALERGADLLFTTHNAELRNRLGPEIVPFTYLVHRTQPGDPSAVVRIDEIERLPQLLGMGGVGSMAASGRMQTLLD